MRFLIFFLFSTLLVSGCADTPVGKLTNPHSSYYQKIHASAAALDGNQEAEKFYRDPKNEGLDYYAVQRKIQKEEALRKARQYKGGSGGGSSGFGEGLVDFAIGVYSATAIQGLSGNNNSKKGAPQESSGTTLISINDAKNKFKDFFNRK